MKNEKLSTNPLIHIYIDGINFQKKRGLLCRIADL